jgi:hypothetical protein
MNVNIILDSDYICNKLTEGEEKTINNLFSYFKNKTNIIILLDNNKNLLKKIVKHEKISNQNIKNTEIFLTSLINGTNKIDYKTKEKYENNFIEFAKDLITKKYPIQIVISDKKINDDIETFQLEELDKIFQIIEKFSEKHYITDNETLLADSNNSNIKSFEDYEEILFNTFWCSSKITIVAKEFWEGIAKGNFTSQNRAVYEKSLKYLIKIFNQIEKITGEKIEIEIITGVRARLLDEFKMSIKTFSDEAYDFLKKIDGRINFKLKILKWDTGNEGNVGESHGRRIYSNYGGLETGNHPFDLFNNKLNHKDSSFHWISEKEHLNLPNYMLTLADRPVSQL